jgi:DNA-directed RNA polymerase alpha subunit
MDKMMKMVINAGDLKLGMEIPEADGFLFEVVKIEKETEKSITVRLASDYSSFISHWKENGGVAKTFRKSTKLYTLTEVHYLDYLLNEGYIGQRTFNTLKRAGFDTMEDVKNSTAEVIENIYNMSKISLSEIKNAMYSCFGTYFNFKALILEEFANR